MTDVSHHYIAIDAIGWAVANDPDEALQKRVKDSNRVCNYVAVYLVPVPENTYYDINEYKPVVKGAKLIRQLKLLKCNELIADEEIERLS